MTIQLFALILKINSTGEGIMHLQEFINENKAIILKKWVSAVISTYPADASRFLTNQKDQFANPLGSSITHGLSDLLEILCAEKSAQENISSDIEQLIKIRAVQEFSPAMAIGFIFDLKAVVLHLYKKEKNCDCLMDEWLAFASRIDVLALTVFDLYMASRERIFKVRMNEIASGSYLVADRMTCPSVMMRREKAQQARADKVNASAESL